MMEWKQVKLGEVCDYVKDKVKTSAFPLSAYISTENMLPNKGGIVLSSGVPEGKATAYRQNDVLVSNIRPYFKKIWYASHDGSCSNDVLCFRANDNVDSLFLYLSLCQDTFFDYVMLGANGSKMPRGNRQHIMQYDLSLPPLPIQRRIAAILSSLDAQIENNNRINANLEAQAQALFKSWFVDFEPWGGVMPEGWREGKLGEIAQLLNGFAFKSDSFIEDGKYQLITIKGVQDGALTTDGAVKINDIPSKMPTWCLLEKGDILLSLTGNVGRCCYVDRDNLLLNQRVAKIQPLQEYNRMFVYTLFRTETMKSRLISLSRGTAQANLSPIETSHLEILIPSKEVLKCFGEKSNSILNQMINNTEANARLASLRDTLLPKLMKGEIEV